MHNNVFDNTGDNDACKRTRERRDKYTCGISHGPLRKIVIFVILGHGYPFLWCERLHGA